MQQSILEEIRNYTFQNKELLNSHHFLFGCPIQKNMKSTDVIILGKNPGGDQKKILEKLFSMNLFQLKNHLIMILLNQIWAKKEYGTIGP